MAVDDGRKAAPLAAPDERRAIIVAEVRLQGGATVRALARACGVSVGTIRRDLRTLEDGGLVHKVHGGAVAPEVVAVLGVVALGAEAA